MNKDLVIKNARKKFKGDLLKIVEKQIDDYFDLASSSYEIINKYKVGQEVILNENHLLHGIGNHTEILDLFSKRGIVSQDYLEENSNHAFCYESAFWKVSKEIKLKDYIKNYSGMIAKYNGIYEQVPYGKLDDFVEKMKNVDHWSWTAESSMEIRFMPSLAKDVNQIGFIINTEHEIARRMRKNSVFQKDFNKCYAYEFISGKAKEKYLKNGFVDDFFQRADYLIFGLPRCLIEGIIVGRKIENDSKYLDKIKEMFVNCYIVNLDGYVIK